MTRLLLAGAMPAVIGFLLVHATASRLGSLVRVCLAIGLGIGCVSCCFFVSLMTGLPVWILEFLLIVGFGAACWRLRRAEVDAQLRAPMTGLERWLAAAFAAVVLCGIYGFISMTRTDPHGQWDAWSIWNLHARFLATPYWRDAFSPALAWSHPDYPLLLPGFIAYLWRASGARNLAVPAVTAFVFTFGTAGVLVGALAALKGRVHGFLAGMLLIGTPFFVAHGAAQYADVPLSFYMLCTLVLCAMQYRFWPEMWKLSVLAAAAAGMAAWTKNEGLLLVSILVPMQALIGARRNGWQFAAKQSGLFAIGLAPIMAVILWFKFAVATQSMSLETVRSGSVRSLIFDFSRWKIMGQALVEHGYSFGGLGVSVFLLLAAYLVCVGVDWRGDRVSVQVLALTLGLLLLGYCAFCVISPFDIHWQINTALDRLLLQLWPSVVFLGFLISRSPTKQDISENCPANGWS